MVSRQYTKKRQEALRTAKRRYEKERQKNILAQPGPHEFILILDHLKAGFNVPKIFRSAEAFGAKEIHLINIAQFDPAPAKGAFRKVPAFFHDDFHLCYQQLRKRDYTLFILEAEKDNILYDIKLPKKSAFIMGNEGVGISFEKNQYPDIPSLSIAQYGSIESLNVSVAASIVMYEYLRQHKPTS